MTSLTLLAHDVRLQLRQGFYAAYAVLTLGYVVVFAAAPPALERLALPLVLFSDPGVLGFFFMGGLVLLERADGTLRALFVTTLSVRQYLAGKALSLTLLALVTSVAIAAAVRGAAFDPLLLVGAVLLTAPLSVLGGAIVASRARGVTHYVWLGVLSTTPLCLPFLSSLGLFDTPLFRALPTDASLRLLAAAFATERPPLPALLAHVAVLLVWTAGAFVWAERWFQRYVVEEHGAHRPSRRPRASGPAPLRSSTSVWAALLAHDLRGLVRSPSFVVAASLPLGLALAVRLALPAASLWARPYVDLAAYHGALLAMLLVLSPFLVGWQVGFSLLDERDERALEAVAVTPLGKLGFLSWRLLLPSLVGFGIAALAVPLSGLGGLSPVGALGTALLASLVGPIVAAALVGYASNKVAGLAVVKLLSLLLLAPAIAFVAPEPWRWLGGVLPTFWVGELGRATSPGAATLATGAGLVVAGVWLLASLRRFQNRLG